MSKRVLTQDAHTASNLSFQSSASDTTPEDLNACLQNVGRRIRRSVSAGYATHRFSSASPMQAATSTSINESPIFRSSYDTLHAVYSQPPPSTLAPSDKKRTRAESSVDEPEELIGDGNREQDDEGSDTVMQSASTIGASDLALSRPMKPLRRTHRTFGKTKSLPATVFESRVDEEVNTTLKADSQEEEDWSIVDFSGDPSKPHTLA
ncbi:hypothetical protein BJY52DRAFT_44181 [Lactarius psammicola]|nr:hypothetical protein BJY52DRAFT_44181 [Lactarius psammicola]